MATFNSNNAFATAKPLEGSISDDIQQQEENGFRRRQEQRIEDQIAEQKINREQAKKDALRQKMLGQIPKNYNTGSSSLNEFQAKIIQQGANRLGEIYETLGKENIPESDKIKLQIEAQNIENLPDNLKVATDNFSQLIKDYQTGVETGSFFKNPDFEKLVLNGFENYVGTLDNGLPTVGFIDTNKDGTIDIKDVQTYDNLSQGIGTWNFQKQFDLDKMAVATAKGLKPVDRTTERGYMTTQVKEVPDAEIDKVAQNTLYTQEGTPSESLLSELRKRNLPNTSENQQLIKQYYKDRIKANTDQLYKENFDYAALNSANRLNYQKSKDSPKEKKSSLGNFSYTSNRKENGQIIGNVYQYDGNPIKRKVGRAEEILRSFEIDKNGNLVAVVNVENPKYTPSQLAKMISAGDITQEQAVKLAEESSITTRSYTSKNNNDDVMEFGREFINPKTRKSAKNASEIIKYLKETGGENLEEKRETPAERALRIANGG